jgi:uncharacterized membrane protein
MKEVLIITYVYYTVSLLLITGILVLVFDTKRYDTRAKNYKVQKGASILGWLNISLGIVLFIGYWVYDKWFWK